MRGQGGGFFYISSFICWGVMWLKFFVFSFRAAKLLRSTPSAWRTSAADIDFFFLALSQWRVEIRRDFASPTACVFPSVCHPERRAKPAVEILRSKIAEGGISDGKIRLHFVSLRMTPSVSGDNINCLLWQSLFFLPFGTVLFTRVKSTQKARLREGAYTPPLP